MAKPYATEMTKLADTFAWTMATDVAPLRAAVKTAGLSGLLAIGSGGSLTGAHVLAGLHSRWTRRLAAVATPLEAVVDPLDPSIATWLLSAGGGNVDILRAFNVLAAREPRQLGVLCGKSDSALADAARKHPFTDLLLYEPPAGKDGFLATNSLLAFAALLTRAYVSEFGAHDLWNEAAMAVEGLLQDSAVWAGWEEQCSSLWGRSTTLVLHGTSTRFGAIDLESKFTEAALGNLQIADFRNFAHGRHHWLAKRGDITGIIVFVAPDDCSLAAKTLSHIPPEIPRAVLTFEASPSAMPMLSLIAALRITGWAGEARSIDPGRPGVPDFGRKLYNLPLPKLAGSGKGPETSDQQLFAITRKSGLSLERLQTRGELERWRKALAAFKARLAEAIFDGVILDYDGTIVDTRRRFEIPQDDVVAELIRLSESGVGLAIATGRGASVRRDLRECLPPSLWSRILVGYYNGADIARLDEDAPDGTEGTCDALASLAKALREQPELADAALQTDRRFQITLEAKRALPENRLWDLAHEVVLMLRLDHAAITRSSHSVDIVTEGVTKRNVLDRMRRQGSGCLLAIGDRGRWPGNDFELLREPHALSVDEVSVDPDTCWNLAPIGQRGVAATIAYLRCLHSDGDAMSFDVTGLQ
jgi:hypothetical protein